MTFPKASPDRGSCFGTEAKWRHRHTPPRWYSLSITRPKAAISGKEARRVFCMGFQQRGFIPRVEGPRTKDRTEDQGVGLYTGRRSG